MMDLYRLLSAEVDALMAELGQPAYRAKQLLDALYRRRVASLDEVREFPAGLRARMAEAGWVVGSATEVRRAEASEAMTVKLLLELQRHTLIETVLMQYPADEGRHPRSTVCVSTQAGCAMGCVFCATGQMGFERNLKAEEVVAQVIQVARMLDQRGQHITNVVFMGMGEPLANYAESIRAVRLLSDPRAFGLAQRGITLSTVGLVHAIDRLAAEDLQIGLAISLHAPNDELRRRLVPIAGPTSVADLVAAAGRYFLKTGRRVSFEYALIEGVNDGLDIADELAALLRGKPTHVNIIPVNATAGGFRRPSSMRVQRFAGVLQQGGINVTVRTEKGSRISAACGQLRTAPDSVGPDVIGLDEITDLPAAPVHGRRQSQSAQAQFPLPAPLPT
jgi:23S rRNA (adenine2503-C2)-methyltransferase